jgi:predicted CopG family antitoxin
MPNITLSIPEDIYKKMKMLNDIRWSEIARRAIEERINDLEVMNKITSKSKLTKKDVEEISKKINSRLAKRFYEYNSN